MDEAEQAMAIDSTLELERDQDLSHGDTSFPARRNHLGLRALDGREKTCRSPDATVERFT